jgi:hypothetical protein
VHFNARLVGANDGPGAGEAGDDEEDDDNDGDAGKSRHSFGSARGLTGVGWDKQTAGKKRRRATVPFTGAGSYNNNDNVLYSDSGDDSGYDTEAQKRRC